MKNILVRRTGALGDVILATGIIRTLQEQGNRVDVVTQYGKVFANNSQVRVNPNAKMEDYDQVIDLDMVYELNPSMHIIDAYAQAAGVNRNECSPELWVTEKDREVAKSLPGKFIAIHMRNHFWPNRNLPVDFWMNLMGRIIGETGVAVVQVGDGNDRSFGEIPGSMYDVVGKLSIHECAAVIERAEAFIGADAGLYHVAACTKTPILGFFTSVRAEYREPIGRVAPHINIASNIQCYGCAETYPAPLTQYRCDNVNKEECTRRFDVGDSFSKLQALLTWQHLGICG